MTTFSLTLLCLASFGVHLIPVHCAYLRTTQSNATNGKHVVRTNASLALPAWVSSCKYIYLDLGSSIGVQIRKLYEPRKYPQATVTPVFDQYFGYEGQRRLPATQNGMCALGFEPNPMHYSRLEQLEAAYMAKGWHVHFFKAAVWSSAGSMTFTGVGNDPGHRDWGAKLRVPLSLNNYDVEVPTVDIAAFVQSLPANSVQLMKMDIEGAEYECVPHMINHHTLCANTIKAAFAEAHAWGNTRNWPGQRNFASIKWHVDTQQGCPAGVTQFIDLDDESYLHDVDDNFGYP
mmetsp:Transcript_37571/g.59436  ORF Transcript_37571/g.59436 Transcript_37571/m.59436 type:complete len:289 (-) Transcript_37571:118-984(-)|eukprot:CAMPEP_0169131536 /NCGR_PEP_ID=MMETSP1015-20121227/38299_1 /TAXON_ID=342587 /ORGANISM="Karlodinium micrum, Strain CCMP2283" /LENGTH=288 /DNA_ID=CAMNT_0009195803 /DNA_START=54 /DNA_END=920 /DNA_ORIENTATION=+